MPFDGTNTTAVDEVAIILRARHVLIRDGWCKKQLHNQWGNHCVLGALCAANSELTNADRMEDILDGPVWKATHTLKKSLGITTPLYVWNDSRKRNEEEVLLALKFAADWATERKLRESVSARIKAAVFRIFMTAKDETYDFRALIFKAPNDVARSTESEPPAPATDDAAAHHDMVDA